MTTRKEPKALDRWGPLDVDYFDNPKTFDLVLALGPRADVFPPRMWMWAFKHAPAGVFKSPGQVELACRWDGAPGLCAQAMKDVGFLEKDGVTIHDWFAPGHIGYMRRSLEERRKNGREYAAARRGAAKGATATTVEEHGPEQEVMRLLMQRASQAKIVGRKDTLRTYLEGWKERMGAAADLEQALMSLPKGLTIIEVQEKLFPKLNGQESEAARRKKALDDWAKNPGGTKT